MANKRPPARLEAYFLLEVPLCIIVRKGPAKYSRLIKWNTKSDEIELGSWVHGKVGSPTFTPDGKYMAFGIMGGWQRAVIVKPPWTYELAKEEGGLCYTSLTFDKNGDLNGSSSWRGTDGQRLPFLPSKCSWDSPDYFCSSRGIYSGKEAASIEDQQGRKITLSAGCIYVDKDGEDVLLLDTNDMEPGWVEFPDWAKQW